MGRGDRLLIALAGAAALGSVAASLASDVAGVARHPGYSPVADLIGELHAPGSAGGTGRRGAPGPGPRPLRPGRRRPPPVVAHRRRRPGLSHAGATRPRRRGADLPVGHHRRPLRPRLPPASNRAGSEPFPADRPGLVLLPAGGGRAPPGDAGWRRLARHSRLTLGLATVGAAAVVVALGGGWLGLAERLFAYASLQWLAFLGVVLVGRSPGAGSATPARRP